MILAYPSDASLQRTAFGDVFSVNSRFGLNWAGGISNCHQDWAQSLPRAKSKEIDSKWLAAAKMIAFTGLSSELREGAEAEARDCLCAVTVDCFRGLRRPGSQQDLHHLHFKDQPADQGGSGFQRGRIRCAADGGLYDRGAQ